MIARKATVGLLAAIVIAVCSFVPPNAIAANKGVAVRFGGSASPFGAAFEGADNTRYYRHFGFAGHFFYRVPSEILGENSFYGLRFGMSHLTNDVRRGGLAMGLFAQFPIILAGELGKELWGFPMILRAGAGVNLTSFGPGQGIFDFEDANKVNIRVDTKTAPVFLVGAGLEYKLSALTSIALDTDLIIGTVETDWEILGQSANDPPFQDSNLNIRHFAIMIGVNILLAPGGGE